MFDRNLLRSNRYRFNKLYNEYNFLYHEIADRIVENLQLFTRKFNKVLEISARDQYLSKLLIAHNKAESAFYTDLIISSNDKKNLIIADDEFLPFKKESFDLIISNLNLQHINNVPNFLLQIKNLLKPEGFFIASFFAEENLKELQKAVFEAEIELCKGASPRIIPTIDIKTAANLLQKAGFNNSVATLEEVKIEYVNLQKLFYDLQRMGQGNILNKRSRKFMTKNLFNHILDKYPVEQGNKSFLASFQIVIISAKK